MFGRGWEPGSATIVERHAKLRGDVGHSPQYRFVADVAVPGTSPFRAKLRSPLWLPDRFLAPQPGQVVRVKADAKRQKAKFDLSDPWLQRNRGNLAAMLQGFVAEREAAGPASQAGIRSEQLRQLAALKEQGRLTDAEYEQAREVVDRI